MGKGRYWCFCIEKHFERHFGNREKYINSVIINLKFKETIFARSFFTSPSHGKNLLADEK